MNDKFSPNLILKEIASIDTSFREAREDLGVDSLKLMPQEDVRAKLVILYGLQTDLRRLKRRLFQQMITLQESLLSRQLDRVGLEAWKQESARAGLIVSDINALLDKMSQVITRCQRFTGKPIYLYALSHPLTGEVLYVGKTRDPEARLKEHLAKPSNEAMARWFESISAEGLTPAMEIIDLATNEDWMQKEARQIWRYRQMGFQLLNRDGPSE